MSDGHNARFLANPRLYLTQVAVVPNNGHFGGRTPRQQQLDAATGRAGGAAHPYDRVFLNLVPTDGGGANARVVRPDFSTSAKWFGTDIVGGYTPYINDGVVRVDHNKLGRHQLGAGGVPKFEFTGPMQGCSLVLCTAAAGGAYWSVHYPNTAGAAGGFAWLAGLGLNCVKSVDFYNLGAARGPQVGYSGLLVGGDERAAAAAAGKPAGFFNCFAFMMFEHGGWRLIAQPQLVWQERDGSFNGQINGAVVEV